MGASWVMDKNRPRRSHETLMQSNGRDERDPEPMGNFNVGIKKGK
jgi:hypothetical protein